MNPPFHNRKGTSTNTIVIRDDWDFDFVKRAYVMLKIGGELVAIMSKHCTFGSDKESVEFIQFLETVEHVQEIKKTKNRKHLDVVVVQITKINTNYDNYI